MPIACLDDERLCRLCGSTFLPEYTEQLYCSDECEVTDRKIDEAVDRGEERRDFLEGKKQGRT
jgi:hypothetical protein